MDWDVFGSYLWEKPPSYKENRERKGRKKKFGGWGSRRRKKGTPTSGGLGRGPAAMTYRKTKNNGGWFGKK